MITVVDHDRAYVDFANIEETSEPRPFAQDNQTLIKEGENES